LKEPIWENCYYYYYYLREVRGVARGQLLDLKVATQPPPRSGEAAQHPQGQGRPRGHPQWSGEAARPSPSGRGRRAATPGHLWGVARANLRFWRWPRGHPQGLGVAPPATYGGGSAPPPLRGGYQPAATLPFFKKNNNNNNLLLFY